MTYSLKCSVYAEDSLQQTADFKKLVEEQLKMFSVHYSSLMIVNWQKQTLVLYGFVAGK